MDNNKVEDDDVNSVGGGDSDSDSDVKNEYYKRTPMQKQAGEVGVPPKKELEEGEVDEDDESIESKSVNSEYDSQAESDGDGDGDGDGEETDGEANAGEEGVLKKPAFLNTMNDSDSDAETDDEEEPDDHYLQKFDESVQKNVIAEFHPELQMHNNDEIEIMSRVVRNENGIIIDPFHKTVPFITRYEKARVLGERAKQIEAGAPLFVDVEPTLIDGYLIALKEYDAKKIPFIIKRPLPSGGCEYWKLTDLEYL